MSAKRKNPGNATGSSRASKKSRTASALQELNRNAKQKDVIIVEDSDDEPEVKESRPLKSKPRKKRSTEKCSVRIVGGRIYDSENGKTCHQCRQKTVELMAGCKSGSCKLNFCPKCLLNRYGEKVEEANKLELWSCPKCQGVCNCSICRKRSGCSPTGGLANVAKAKGFTSVAEYLQEAKNKDALELKESKIKPVKAKKPNSASVKSISDDRRPITEDMQKCDGDKKQPAKDGKKRKKRNEDEDKQSGSATKVPKIQQSGGKRRIKRVLAEAGQPQSKESEPLSRNIPEACGDILHEGQLEVVLDITASEEKECSQELEDVVDSLILPEGEEYSLVAGYELSKDTVGHALQLMEFCSAFRKVLGLRKGQEEVILQEMIHGLPLRGGVVVQLHVKLLSIILEDVGETRNIRVTANGKNPWVEVFKQHLLERTGLSKPHMVDGKIPVSLEDYEKLLQALDHGTEEYDKLDVRTKLQFLNILCDDCLSTTIFRKQFEKAPVKQKEKSEEVEAARKEVIAAKTKQRNLEAKRLLAEVNGASLTEEQCKAILQKVHQQTETVTAAQLALSQMVCKSKVQTCDAVRTEPVTVSRDGRIFWRLKGADDRSKIIIQDVGKAEPNMKEEKWSSYSKEQEEFLLKYMASQRMKKQRNHKPSNKAVKTSSCSVPRVTLSD